MITISNDFIAKVRIYIMLRTVTPGIHLYAYDLQIFTHKPNKIRDLLIGECFIRRASRWVIFVPRRFPMRTPLTAA